MRTPFNAHWLETGACVPVDIETTAILLEEIRRLHHDAFLEKQWADLNKSVYMAAVNAAPIPPAEQEPVAYCYVKKTSSADALTFNPKPVNAVDNTVFPLYAHPHWTKLRRKTHD